MTPLEALREIAEYGPPLIEDAWCGSCQRLVRPIPGADAGPHADFCPWRHMPKIVAALEAARSLVGDGYVVAGDPMSVSLSKWNALVRALKG